VASWLDDVAPYTLKMRARLLILCVVAVVAGCSRTPAIAPLADVALPDLSRLDASVQTQIKGSYAGLTRTRESASVSDAQLGAAYGEFGVLLHAAGYLDAAERAYDNAQTLMPADARWPYSLSLVARAKGDTAKAQALLARTLDLEPNDLAALIWLGRTYLDQGNVDAAEPLFVRAQSVAPKTIAVLAGRAQVALARKDYARAVALLEEGLAIDPRADSLHAQLATAYRGLGNTAQADAHVKLWRNTDVPVPDPRRDAVDSALESGLSYDLRGMRAMGSGDYRSAIDLLRRGVELSSGSTQLGRSLRHKLGTALMMTGDNAGALRLFEEVISLAPTGPDEPAARAHYSLGIIDATNGRTKDAIAQFTKAVAFSPSYVEARLALGDALRAAGQPEASLPHYAEAVRNNPRAADARLGYALALVRLRRYDAAKAWLDESVTAQPDRPELAHTLARLLVSAPDDRVRNGQRALAMMQELYTSYRTAYVGETMAMTLAEVGRFDEAIAIQRNAVAAARQTGTDIDVRRTTTNLALYQRRLPCRVPWPDDDPIHTPGPRPAQVGTL
jgi:tetratricopeptide (TPR) repeat protein